MARLHPDMKQRLLEIVENQLRDGKPPEARQTLERLMAQGYSAGEARQLIASAAASEMFEVIRSGRPYNEARYVAALQRLPELPGEDTPQRGPRRPG